MKSLTLNVIFGFEKPKSIQINNMTYEELDKILNSWEKVVRFPIGTHTTFFGGEEYNDNMVMTLYLDNVKIHSIEEHDMELKEQFNLSAEWTEQP